ncbi:MAG: RNA polymerase sigma factor [Phycisphaerales bacterium]|nr:RNA polymerase sigma factor [Phycisphaerales bacterium]
MSDDASNLSLHAGLQQVLQASRVAGPTAQSDDAAWNPDMEAQIVARAKAEPRAFAAIYRAYYPGVVRYLFRRLGDEHTAEDLAAETFIRAMRSIGRYESRGLPLKSWLLRIATNEAHRWARRNGRRAGVTGPAPEEATAPQARADADRLRVVQQAFLALPAKWQDVLALHHLEHLGVEQVALVLDCRAGTVKSRLSRAREALRRELERRRYTHDSQA